MKSDLKIALDWIYGEDHHWKPYIESRLTEIRQLTKISQWYHNNIIGEGNPIGLPTRCITVFKLQELLFGISGPSWLHDLKEETTILRNVLLLAPAT